MVSSPSTKSLLIFLPLTSIFPPNELLAGKKTKLGSQLFVPLYHPVLYLLAANSPFCGVGVSTTVMISFDVNGSSSCLQKYYIGCF